MSKHYVDNAMNRSLGRVGMAHGTAVHSRSSGGSSSGSYGGSSSGSYGGSLSGSYGGSLSGYGGSRSGSTSGSYSSPRSGTYVDNSSNRSLGRVGMEYGGAVNSSASSSSSSSKSYVDNSLNRSLGRVGLELGTAVHRPAESSLRSSSSSSSSKSYVDNALNRSLGRVGLELGTAVHRPAESSRGSSSSSSSSKSYVDNALNRSLGRVGLELGTAVHRPAESSRGSVGSLSSRMDSLNLQNPRNYKDNYLNRKLGRVGQPIQRIQGKGQEYQHHPQQCHSQDEKVYVDNAYNRKHNRVGKPKGSAPVPTEQNVYKDTPLNRALDRVGQPWGSFKGKPQAEIMSKLNKMNFNDEVPEDIVERFRDDTNTRDKLDAILEAINREGELRRRAEEVSDCEELDAHQHTSKTVMDKHKGQAIDFKIATVENQSDEETEDVRAQPESAVKSYKGKVINYDALNLSKKKIGHGNFGDVFSAEWTEGQLVAVKVLRYQQMANKRVKLFEKEISLYCKLDHPNIVSFIGACVTRPNLAFVMEYMEMSLRDALDVKEVEFDNKDKVNITRDMSKGLTYLHLKNIAHCDFKPSNILLNNVPGGERYDPKKPVLAKLTDFGLSILKADTESTSSNMDSVKNVGTPRYSAPEVLCGEFLDVDDMKKADVYSIALTVLELLLEEAPFENLNVMQLRKQVGEKGLKPKMTNGKLLDPDFKSYIDKCLSSEANNRPTAEDFTSFVLTKDLLSI